MTDKQKLQYLWLVMPTSLMKSNIIIDDSTFNKKVNIKNSNIKLTKKINFSGNKVTNNNFNLDTIDVMLTFVDVVKNKNLRGSDFTNK